jgi:hypothetical protein
MPTFAALQGLRQAYQIGAKHGPAVCADPLRQVLGSLEAVRDVRELAGQLGPVDGTYVICPDTHEQIIAKESQFVRDIGGDVPDKSTLRRALHGVAQIEKSEWCRSADDLASHLRSTHHQISASFEAARWRDFGKRRRNAMLMRWGDQAALAVVIVLVDLLHNTYIRESYRIGAYLANEANSGISNTGGSSESARRSASCNGGSAS